MINSVKNAISAGLSTTSFRKTSIDKSLISLLEKNFMWISNLLEEWKSEFVTRLSLQQVMDKVMEPSLYGKAFTGALVINKSIYTFIYDGYFIGAIDINSSLTGEIVFQTLPKTPETMELKIPSDEHFYSPVIIACLIEGNGEVVQKNLDSSLVNLVPLIENLTSEEEPFTGYLTCFSETNIFYYGFYKGQQLFSAAANKADNKLGPDTYLNLKELVSNQGIVLNAFSARPVLVGPTVSSLLRNSNVMLKYKNSDKSNLYNIVDLNNEEVPIHIIKETKQNTFLDLNLNQSSKLMLLDQEIDLLKTVKESVYYHFTEWMVNEYFYLLNSSGNITSLKYIYTWIPATEQIKFFESLKGEDDNNYEFSIVFHGQVKGENYKKVLMMVRFGMGTKQDVDKFIEDVTNVKKKLIKSGDIGGAIYISTDEFSGDALKLFYERTVEPRKGFGLGSLDKLTKYKGFVRIGFGRGFHLNLIEYRKRDDSFQVIAPLLK